MFFKDYKLRNLDIIKYNVFESIPSFRPITVFYNILVYKFNILLDIFLSSIWCVVCGILLAPVQDNARASSGSREYNRVHLFSLIPLNHRNKPGPKREQVGFSVLFRLFCIKQDLGQDIGLVCSLYSEYPLLNQH